MSVFEKFPELLYDKYPEWGGGEVEEETDPEELPYRDWETDRKSVV